MHLLFMQDVAEPLNHLLMISKTAGCSCMKQDRSILEEYLTAYALLGSLISLLLCRLFGALPVQLCCRWQMTVDFWIPPHHNSITPQEELPLMEAIRPTGGSQTISLCPLAKVESHQEHR